MKRDEKQISDIHNSNESSRRGKTIQITLDPTASLAASHPALIEDERWIESQLEDPERWDGLS